MSNYISIAILVFIASLSAFSQQATNRVALVIGVKDYEFVSPLSNPLNDAIDVSAALKEQGFTVIQLLNPSTKREIQEGVLQYYDLIASSRNTSGLIYYSGHGLQVDGKNYLMPTSSNPRIKADLDDQAVNMTYILQAMEQAGNGLNIFILDACRNSPFRSFSRSVNPGLSQVNAPKGSYIVYATSPGSVASDGNGRNGLFTAKFLKYVKRENISLESLFKNVAKEVQEESNGDQVPWINYSYFGDFYFNVPQERARAENQEMQPKDAQKEVFYSRSPANEDPNELNTETLSIEQSPTKKEAYTDIPNYLSFNNEYSDVKNRTAIIKEQEWLIRNLNVSLFRNGDKIPQAQTNREWRLANKNKQPAWCFYKNDSSNGQSYGKLYNWYAVNDPRGLAPEGWHIPSSNEFSTLKAEVSGTINSGKGFKSTSYWNKFTGNNSSGVTALPSGWRFPDGSFAQLGKAAAWWTTTESKNNKVWYVTLYGGMATFTKQKGAGFAVRCIRD